MLDKTIRDIAVAEQQLLDSLVPFQALDDKSVSRREGFAEHLDDLKRLLVKHKVSTVTTADGRVVAGPLSPWRETEQALGISESQRKAKLGVLRLDPRLLDDVRELPAEHAIQISRLQDARQQSELVERARELSHRQVHDAVDRLLKNAEMTVADAVAGEAGDQREPDRPLSFDTQLQVLADLCRQLTRALANLRSRLGEEAAVEVRGLLAGLGRELDTFEFGFP